MGSPCFWGGNFTPSRAEVQIGGKRFRLIARLMKDKFDQSEPVMHLLLRYALALITQISLTTVCNRHHSLD